MKFSVVSLLESLGRKSDGTKMILERNFVGSEKEIC